MTNAEANRQAKLIAAGWLRGTYDGGAESMEYDEDGRPYTLSDVDKIACAMERLILRLEREAGLNQV